LSGELVHVRTDDDIYRVDSVWLGPPRATFPWRVRYVGYGLGLIVMILVMFVQRRVGIALDFFSVAWALILTVVITRFVGSRINYERPLGQVLGMFGHEVTGPRRRTATAGGAVRSRHVRVRSAATPHPAPARKAKARALKAAQVTPAKADPWAHSRRDPWAAADRRRGAGPGKGRGRRATA
jgi:hypothetical protein